MAPAYDDSPYPRADRTNPMGIVVRVCLLVGAVAYIVLSLFRSEVNSQGFLLFAGVVAGVVYLLTMIDIRIGMACLFLAIGISPELEIGGVSNIRLEDFIVPVLTLTWITRHMQNREEFVPTPLRGPIIAFLSVAVISALMGTMAGEVELRKSFLVLGKTVVYFLLFLIVLNNTRTLPEFKAYVVLTVLVTLISCANTYALPPSPDTAPSERLQGPYGESGNIYAGYLGMNLCIMIGLFVYASASGGRFTLGVCILGVLYAMLATLSRTTYVAIAIAVIGFGLFKARRIAALFLSAILLVGLVVPDRVLQKAATILQIPTEDQPESFRARVLAWEGSIPKIEQAPLFGHGISYIAFGWVDNEYVRVALDMGLLGLAAFLWLLVAMARMALRTHNAVPDDPLARGYAAGYCMALICMSIHAWGATSFASIRTMEAFMVITGLAGALYANLENWGLANPARVHDPEHLPEPSPAPF